MRNFFRNRRAESLIEVLVAVTVIVMASSSAMMLLTNAIKANAGTRNRIVATSLAREAVEMTENIIRTNMMRFGSYKNLCWNFQEEISKPNVCPVGGANPRQIAPSTFVPVLDESAYKWYLVENSASSLTDAAFALFRTKPTATIPAMYVSRPGNTANYDETVFFRRVKVRYVELQGQNQVFAPNGGAGTTYHDYDLMEITGEVGWVESGELQTVTFTQLFPK